MIDSIFKFFLGSRNDRIIKKLNSRVAHINDLEPQISKLSDDQLRAKTNEFKTKLENGASLDFILDEAFAVVREASKRTVGLRHFDVQLIGGIVLHEGKIAEMRTGEGKTLVATAPMYLNALSGKGAHLITVNDYLAERDLATLGPIYEFLGLTYGTVINSKSDRERKEVYSSDITYGTNNEFGFDYLKDNMRFHLDERVQRGFNFAIVDEVDSILIDEARTPLIISGQGDSSSDLYTAVDKVIKKLTPEDYEKEEKHKNITLSEKGIEHVEKLLVEDGLVIDGNLYDIKNMNLVHYVNQSLKANYMFKKEVDYIVKNNKVIIIDEFTGRIMDGRRYSDGLHQALEAKENVPVQTENQTLASITFQNFFRMYHKLSGMTGTAMTEAGEFAEIYNLETIQIPTNKPVARIDEDDEIYRTEKEKFSAMLDKIKEIHGNGQPILVGTASIEKSELVSNLLKKAHLPHNVLNAKYHEYEAQIIAEAGAPGAITIATNMAGRGTDIKLGGNLEKRLKDALEGIDDINERSAITAKIEEQYKKDQESVVKAGGLFIMGTERHESRRIDNQLRGRAGRQGDPGHSKFYLSLQDDLMRIFGGDKLDAMLQRIGLNENEAITHPWVNKAIEKAQKRVEAHNFDIRKHLLKFDDVANEQRNIIYKRRLELMQEDYDIDTHTIDAMNDVLEQTLDDYLNLEDGVLEVDVHSLKAEVLSQFNVNLLDKDIEDHFNISRTHIKNFITEEFFKTFNDKKTKYTPEKVENAAKATMLNVLDQKWKEHLLNLDRLRQGVNLRAYAQKDPLNEYKVEAFNMFNEMIFSIKKHFISLISRLEIQVTDDIEAVLNILSGKNNFSNLQFLSDEIDILNTTPKASKKDPKFDLKK